MKTLLDLDASVIEELTERQQHQLAEVLERYLEDLERGAPADVDRLIASHPDLAVRCDDLPIAWTCCTRRPQVFRVRRLTHSKDS